MSDLHLTKLKDDNGYQLVDPASLPKGGGLRHNSGKLRYDLVHPKAHEGMVKVLTKGAAKYAERNWEKGMKWSFVIQSLERHLASFKAGEDYDPETGCLHVDHMQCNAHFLSAYYAIAPQCDDRPHIKHQPFKIALDIDEVICNWVEAWCEIYGIVIPTSWYFQWNIKNLFDNMADAGILDQFYSSLSPRVVAAEMPFEPVAYISHRPVGDNVTKDWLEKHGFPLKPVIHVKDRADKVKHCLDLGVEIFVDDNYDTFLAMNQAGVCCYLMDAPHNRRYDVGYRRINSLSELPR